MKYCITLFIISSCLFSCWNKKTFIEPQGAEPTQLDSKKMPNAFIISFFELDSIDITYAKANVLLSDVGISALDSLYEKYKADSLLVTVVYPKYENNKSQHAANFKLFLTKLDSIGIRQYSIDSGIPKKSVRMGEARSAVCRLKTRDERIPLGFGASNLFL